MSDNTPYAYQAWHCSECERTADHSGSIVEDPPGSDTWMHCEVCGTGYDHNGRHVPGPDDVYDDDADDSAPAGSEAGR